MQKKDVDKLAQLARIKITDDEKDRLTKDLSSIVEYVNELQGVIAELPEIPEVGVIRNVLRDDSNPHEKGIYTEEILREMPDKKGGYLRVKKIL